MRILRRLLSKFLHIYYEKKSRSLKVIGKILMFHNVGGSYDSLYNISTVEFESLLIRLSKHKVIKLEEWENSNDFYALTIDDVPCDFYRYAYPLLVIYNIPFTIFVASNLLDKTGYITTSQLKEMSKNSLCTVGSHGVNHGEYAILSMDDITSELKDSKVLLESIINKEVKMYAFPYGSFYACGYKYKNRVMKYYKYGYSTVQIPITHPRLLENYFIPRINVTSKNINTL